MSTLNPCPRISQGSNIVIGIEYTVSARNVLKKIALWVILTVFLVQTLTIDLQYSLVDDPPKPLVLVIVHSSIYATVESSLNQYAADVENEGFSVDIIETSQIQNETPQGIRSHLQSAMNCNLVGALFVGDIPEVWYEVGDEKILTDMYYKDLNGLWSDSDGDGVYDEHSGDISPEIWLGRLKTSTIAGDEASLIRNYFTKNHKYRNGLLVLPWWRSLAYIDDDGLNWTEEAELSLSQIYTEVTLVADPATTNAGDYQSRLKDPFGYEWVYLMCHGSYDFHSFKVPEEQDPSLWEGTVFSWEYQSIDPRAFFYLFFVCSAAKYAEPGYLAGSAISTDTYGLVSIGSTDKAFSISPLRFFTSLSKGKTIGDAFQEWLAEQSEENSEPQEGDRYQTLFYGLTIVGDPTLRLYRNQNVLLHDISITNVTTKLGSTKDELTLSVTATIENKGNFPENFNFAISAGPYTLKRVHLSLPAETSTTVTATVPQSHKIVLVDTSKTTIKATASTLPEEFNAGDNEKYVQVKGVHIFSPTKNLSPYPIILVLFMIILGFYGFTRIMGSERPPLVERWTKVKSHFTKKVSSLKHKMRKI